MRINSRKREWLCNFLFFSFLNFENFVLSAENKRSRCIQEIKFCKMGKSEEIVNVYNDRWKTTLKIVENLKGK